MTRNEVLQRFCRLAGQVREHEPLTKKAGRSLAADCFCEQSVVPDSVKRAEVRHFEWITGLNLDADVYRFDAKVMVFIERAVRKALRAK